MGLNVTLGVPFQSANQSRILAHRKAWDLRLGLYPWRYAGIFAGNDEGEFNRAAVRNSVVRRFIDSDVLVICDSDSVPEARPLKEAIEQAYEDRLVHFPFDIVRALDPEDQEEYTYGPSAGGCYVFRPSSWIKAGWMDERLGSWGADDRSFLVQLHTLVGAPVHHPGKLTCFWHERDDQTAPEPSALEILRNDYLPLMGKSESLRQYLSVNTDIRRPGPARPRGYR